MSTGCFADRTAFVTGAGAGLGRATARLFAAEGARVFAVDVGTNQLQNLRSHIAGGYNLMMTDSNGNGTGGGGTCFGDSGGPIFHTDDAGNTWLVAVISFGTKYCKGTSGAFRLDNTQARDFLSGFGVPLN